MTAKTLSSSMIWWSSQSQRVAGGVPFGVKSQTYIEQAVVTLHSNDYVGRLLSLHSHRQLVVQSYRFASMATVLAIDSDFNSFCIFWRVVYVVSWMTSRLFSGIESGLLLSRSLLIDLLPYGNTKWFA